MERLVRDRGARRCLSLVAFASPLISAISRLNLRATEFDTLSTAYVMRLPQVWSNAQSVVKSTRFDRGPSRTHFISVFETIIRVLGGLLSAFDLSGDPAFLEKAKDLGEQLLPVFKEGIPRKEVCCC